MITLLLLVLIVSIMLNIFFIKLIRIQLNKIKIYEDWILEFKTDVISTLNTMESIDKRGTFATSVNEKGLFESDDEVGQIFKDIKNLIEKLNQRVE